MNNSKWIWSKCDIDKDVYGEFYDSFVYSGGQVKLEISADSNYAVYVNGNFVNSGQYPDFPHYKVYDELNITRFCDVGKNHLAVIVWYYGMENMSYYLGNAGLRYELSINDKLICYSDNETLSRISNVYQNGYQKIITSQLGYSFHYDITKEDNWKNGELYGFTSSMIVKQDLPMSIRPIHKLTLGNIRNTKIVNSNNKTHFLLDIGYEEVGYLKFRLKSSKKQKITITFGEHIIDGCVRRIIGSRDFSVEVTVGKGENEYFNPFRRLGLRYIEVFCEHPIQIEYLSIIPVEYPVNEIEKTFSNKLRNDIYKTSMRTLRLCMHEHYEDCPWREQGLYAMDSRNQMLFGYYAFGEYAFPRSNLYLFSKDNRKDNHISICVPTSYDLTIPSFSLHYISEVYEYTVYSKDLSLVKEIYPKLKSLISVFINNMKDGLLLNFKGQESDVFSNRRYWNFYEWAEGLDGRENKDNKETIDTALNCLFVIALKYMHEISKMIGIQSDYLDLANKLITSINESFYDSVRGLYVNSNNDNRVSELVNSLCILCGATDDEKGKMIAGRIVNNKGELTFTTLSMLCFKYDALLKVDKDKYKEYILNEIDLKFKKMLDAGATTFWETEKGDADFHNAGSLCHGWSALPIYYYNILLD